MFTSLHSSSTARGSVITIIQSLPIRNCLLYICSAELISNNLKSKTYILLPRNTCFHGSPDLPSYQTFNYKLNLMPEAISELVRQLIHSFKPQDCDSMKSLVDSMPIITCAGKNKVGKVATEITSKGYCSTKNMYYFGIKLHAVAFRRKGTIPFPEMLILSAADENDSTVFKRECVGNLNNREIYADKIYSDIPFYKETKECKKLELFTPVKAIKGESPEITKREKAARDLFSTAVSKVRQPIEALFNWLNEKTNIQRAMKVRSTSGLLVHTMGKIAIALITLIFN